MTKYTKSLKDIATAKTPSKYRTAYRKKWCAECKYNAYLPLGGGLRALRERQRIQTEKEKGKMSRCKSCGTEKLSKPEIRCIVCGERYPISEEKINDPKTILRVGAKRTGKTETADSEHKIQNEAIIEVSRVFMREVRIWRNNSGSAKIGNAWVQFGVPGQGDVSGIMLGGYRVEIEFKRPGCKQSTDQRAFQRMIEHFDGLYLLCDGDIEGQIIEPIRRRLERVQRVIR